VQIAKAFIPGGPDNLLSSQLAPVFALLFGVLLSWAVSAIQPTPPMGVAGVVLIGLVLGLAASGLYSQSRTLRGV
jgi:hypothetical protein